MASQVHQNFHKDCEDAVNKQINMELYSSYVYISMSYYFDRDDVALRHFAEFFKEQSHEEREHAEKLMQFQNKRGGRIILADIKKPEQDEWSNGLEAMQRALQMEKDVNQSLLDLHKLSTGNTDPHLCDFLETHYLDEQVKIIKKLGDHITNQRRLGAPDNGMGEYLFDKHTLSVAQTKTQVGQSSYYFDRDDVALRHFAEFFKEQSHEEREHAEKLMKFQNKRGGRIILEDIKVGLQLL
ncbi:ferritin heavy chain B-like [Heterodontus francisci]|uniref:ferritin heavy chain B-like n=1 Tax=Heterodontus francisci TaxID=7792 RepID=UPI00355AED16